jgi:uncharacterized protein
VKPLPCGLRTAFWRASAGHRSDPSPVACLDPYHCPCDALPGFPFARVIKFGASQLGPTSMSDIDSSAQSPCIRNCCLDDDLNCLGCFRSLEEIKEWGIVDNHRRRIILQNAKQRREAHQTLGEVSRHSISPRE